MLFEKALNSNSVKYIILGQIPPQRKAHTPKCCDLREAWCLVLKTCTYLPTSFMHAHLRKFFCPQMTLPSD